DLLRELKWAASDAVETAGTAALPGRPPTSRGAWVAGAVATLALGAMSIITVRHTLETSPPLDPIQFTIAAPADATFGTPSGGGTGLATQIAVSPDGRRVAFVGHSATGYQLWVRSIGSLDARALSGTEDATFPFWSPDSRYL